MANYCQEVCNFNNFNEQNSNFNNVHPVPTIDFEETLQMGEEADQVLANNVLGMLDRILPANNVLERYMESDTEMDTTTTATPLPSPTTSECSYQSATSSAASHDCSEQYAASHQEVPQYPQQQQQQHIDYSYYNQSTSTTPYPLSSSSDWSANFAASQAQLEIQNFPQQQQQQIDHSYYNNYSTSSSPSSYGNLEQYPAAASYVEIQNHHQQQQQHSYYVLTPSPSPSSSSSSDNSEQYAASYEEIEHVSQQPAQQPQQQVSLHYQQVTVENVETHQTDSKGNQFVVAIPIYSGARNESGRYPCTYCPKSYKDQRNLKNHIKKNHLGTPVQRKPAYCYECGQEFTSIGYLKQHNNVHHNPLHKKRVKSPDQRFACTLCEKSYIYKVDLKRHSALAHNIGTVYECNLCSKVFGRNDQYLKHKKTHTKKN